MTNSQIKYRLSNALVRAEALLLALDGAGLPKKKADALTLVSGELRDSIAELVDDMDDSLKAA